MANDLFRCAEELRLFTFKFALCRNSKSNKKRAILLPFSSPSSRDLPFTLDLDCAMPLTKTLYKSLLRSAVQLARDANTIPATQIVVRGGARTQSPVARARLLERFAYWRSNLLTDPFCASSQDFRRAVAATATTTTYPTPSHIEHTIKHDVYTNVVAEIDVADQIVHLVKAAFRAESPTPTTAHTIGFAALRELEQLQVQFQLTREWSKFNAAVSKESKQLFLQPPPAATATTAPTTTTTTTTATDPLERGLALLVAQRDGVDSTLPSIARLHDTITDMAEMARMVLDSHAPQALSSQMTHEEQIFRAINHVLFVQHDYNVTVDRPPSSQNGTTGSGAHLRHEHQRPIDVNLCFLDQVLQRSQGTPLAGEFLSQITILFYILNMCVSLLVNTDTFL